MSYEVLSLKVAAVTTQITCLKKQIINSFIHSSKINSLLQDFKVLPPLLESFAQEHKKSVTARQIQAIEKIGIEVNELHQLGMQCGQESALNFLLTQGTGDVFNRFYEIRESVINALKILGIEEGVHTFTYLPEKLISQDQVDLKRIAAIINQLETLHDLEDREDIRKGIAARYESLERKSIRIGPVRDEFISIPQLPASLDLVIEHEQIHYGNEIGFGMSGRIFEGKIPNHKEKVAIKVLKCQNLTPNLLASIRTEIVTLSTLSHPSILKLLGYTNTQPFCLVTELLENGSLANFLSNTPQRLTQTDRTIIAIDVARGMSYIHDRGLIHRDLKSPNILLDSNLRARICDFGLVRVKSYEPTTGMIGTPQWMAPEVMMCSPLYDNKVDVFSYGVVLSELLTSKLPYAGLSAQQVLVEVVQYDRRPELPEDTPPKLRQLINACWATDPSKRPSFSQICALLEDPAYHFEGTDERTVWATVGGEQIDVELPSLSDEEEPSLTAARSGRLQMRSDFVGSAMSDARAAADADDLEAFEGALNTLRALNQSSLLATAKAPFAPFAIELLERVSDELKAALLKALREILRNPSIFGDFERGGGVGLVLRLFGSESPNIAVNALLIFAEHSREEYVTVDTLRSVLSFSSSPFAKARAAAVNAAVAMARGRMPFVCSMPVFIYHVLLFGTRPLPQSALRALLLLVADMLECVSSVPDLVIEQLVFIYENAPQQLKPTAAACVCRAIRFDNARRDFPDAFWTKAVRNFGTNRALFDAFKGHAAEAPSMVRALVARASESDDALEALIEFAPEVSDLIGQLLPVRSDSSDRVVDLYLALPPELSVSSEEAYTACRALIAEGDVERPCELLTRFEADSALLQETGLIGALVDAAANPDPPLAVLNVLCTISSEHCFSCFLMLPKPLCEGLHSDDSRRRVATFVLIANLAEHGIRVPFDDALAAAASLVISQPPEVKAVCVRFAEDFAAEAAPFDVSIIPVVDQYARDFITAVSSAATAPRMKNSISEDSEDFRLRPGSEPDFTVFASPAADETAHLLS